MSQIAFSILSLLAECGRISRRTFDLLPYHDRNVSLYLKKLVDGGSIQISGKGGSKSCILLPSGRETLASLVPQRYTSDVFELAKKLARHAERSRLRGDAAAILSLAGFAVHPDDKPPLPAHTPMPPDLQYAGLRMLYQNKEQYQYGEIISNRVINALHRTPVNCFYDATRIKSLRSNPQNKGSNNSRACGVLLTPSNLFRVYHSRDVAMRFSTTGERNFSAFLDQVFTGYLPNDQDAILVFGYGYLAAEKILDNYLNRRPTLPSKGKEGTNAILGTTNLGNPLFYLPLRRESMELLQLMQYPDWRKSLMYYVSAAHYKTPQTTWTYIHGGRQVYILADLNLTGIAIVLRGMMKNPTAPMTLLCLPWQGDFIWNLVKEYGGEQANASVVMMHDQFMDNLLQNHMEPYWAGR